MLDNIIENKVKVFISSKCDNGRYTNYEKRLKGITNKYGISRSIYF